MNTIDASFASQFLQSLHAAVNAHDAPAIAALCCDDVVWEDPAAPQTLHGRDAVLRFHRDIMFPALPDTRIELVDGPLPRIGRHRCGRSPAHQRHDDRSPYAAGVRSHRWSSGVRDSGVLVFQGRLVSTPHGDPEHARSGPPNRCRSARGHTRGAHRHVDATRHRLLGAITSGLTQQRRRP
jgi:hypothetical protein